MNPDDRLTDGDIMRWGPYRHRRLGEVPHDFWRWLLRQEWKGSHPKLVAYAMMVLRAGEKAHWEQAAAEAVEEQEDPQEAIRASGRKTRAIDRKKKRRTGTWRPWRRW